MQITDYVKPELIVVALVLYFVGMWIKPVSYTHLGWRKYALPWQGERRRPPAWV